MCRNVLKQLENAPCSWWSKILKSLARKGRFCEWLMEKLDGLKVLDEKKAATREGVGLHTANLFRIADTPDDPAVAIVQPPSRRTILCPRENLLFCSHGGVRRGIQRIAGQGRGQLCGRCDKGDRNEERDSIAQAVAPKWVTRPTRVVGKRRTNRDTDKPESAMQNRNGHPAAQDPPRCCIPPRTWLQAMQPWWVLCHAMVVMFNHSTVRGLMTRRIG